MKKIIFTLFFSITLLASSSKVTMADSVFGEIAAPAGVTKFNAESESGIGILVFVSNAIKFASVIAGLWVMFNFISAGFTYITANGDKGAYSKIGEKLSLSVLGLVLIVASYTLAGIIGLIIFGDATYIINPQIPAII